MALTTSDYERLNSCLLRLYRELEPDRHNRVMLEILNELTPADSVVLNLFELSTGRYTVITLPDGIVSAEDEVMMGKLLHESPYPAYYVATADVQWKMTSDFMPVENFHETTLWREGLSRWNIEQQICGVLAFENATAHAITINRASGGFTEHERDLLNALHPHLITSYLNALAFGRSQQSLEQMRGVVEMAPGAYGYINADGTVAWLQERTRMWLAEFFADEARYEDGLPMSVRELITLSQRNEQAPEHLERIGPKERLTACLSAWPLGGWMLRLDRMSLSPKLKLRHVPNLSARENEVLRWMVEGKRNAEIATILGISERTVEKHVEAILHALHAENRATAIVRAIEMSAPQA